MPPPSSSYGRARHGNRRVQRERSLTVLGQLQRYVSNRQIHYFIGGSRRFGRTNGGSDAANRIAAWVAENFRATTIGGVTIYDLTDEEP